VVFDVAGVLGQRELVEKEAGCSADQSVGQTAAAGKVVTAQEQQGQRVGAGMPVPFDLHYDQGVAVVVSQTWIVELQPWPVLVAAGTAGQANQLLRLTGNRSEVVFLQWYLHGCGVPTKVHGNYP